MSGMPTPDQTYVQSLDPAAAKPVAVTIRQTTGGNSAAVQHVILTDQGSDTGVTVRSYAGANPVAVFPVDPTGAHITVHTVAAQQLGAPWSVVGSLGASQLGGPWAIVGSTQATQGSSPWVTRAASGGEPLGTVVASVIGQLTVTASLAGVPTIQGAVSQSGSWDVQLGLVRRVQLATFAQTVAAGGSFTVVFSHLEFYTAVRLLFRTVQSSIRVDFEHAVDSGTWLYNQPTTVSTGAIFQYDTMGTHARLSFVNPASATLVQGGVYAQPVT
jgi:hypothetical protein